MRPAANEARIPLLRTIPDFSLSCGWSSLSPHAETEASPGEVGPSPSTPTAIVVGDGPSFLCVLWLDSAPPRPNPGPLAVARSQSDPAPAVRLRRVSSPWMDRRVVARGRIPCRVIVLHAGCRAHLGSTGLPRPQGFAPQAGPNHPPGGSPRRTRSGLHRPLGWTVIRCVPE